MELKIKRNVDLLNEFSHIRYLAPNAILSGSLALMLHGKIKEREANDIDIILPAYVDLSVVGTIRLHPEVYLDKSYSITTKNGTNVDIIVDPLRPWITIDYIKVSHWEHIAVKKAEAIILFGNTKHKEELIFLLSNL